MSMRIFVGASNYVFKRLILGVSLCTHRRRIIVSNDHSYVKPHYNGKPANCHAGGQNLCLKRSCTTLQDLT